MPHYSSLTSTGEDIGIGDWCAVADGEVCIDFDNVTFESEEFDSSYFFENHLKKGIYFNDNNGDAILIVNSYQDSPQFFYLSHDSTSNFYSSFWEYLTDEFSWLNQ